MTSNSYANHRANEARMGHHHPAHGGRTCAGSLPNPKRLGWSLSPHNSYSLQFATCWFEPDAKEAIAHPGVYEYGFRAIKKSPEGQMIIDVPTSGRSGSFGTSGTYNHPKFLIVEYRLTQDDNGTLARKMFPLPVGRGARSITISLP
jgi:hypothetical protein